MSMQATDEFGRSMVATSVIRAPGLVAASPEHSRVVPGRSTGGTGASGEPTGDPAGQGHISYIISMISTV